MVLGNLGTTLATHLLSLIFMGGANTQNVISPSTRAWNSIASVMVAKLCFGACREFDEPQHSKDCHQTIFQKIRCTRCRKDWGIDEYDAFALSPHSCQIAKPSKSMCQGCYRANFCIGCLRDWPQSGALSRCLVCVSDQVCCVKRVDNCELFVSSNGKMGIFLDPPNGG